MMVIDKMAYKAQVLLGQISKVYGYEGFVVVKLEDSFITNYKEQESVFLEIEGKPVPFFIEQSQYSGGDSMRIKFDDYNTPESVKGFVGSRVFLTTDKLIEGTDDDEFDVDALIGFSVYILEGRFVGKITGIFDNSSQMLMSVDSPGGKEIFIPLHDDFIVDIDENDKILTLDLPDDLLTIND